METLAEELKKKNRNRKVEQMNKTYYESRRRKKMEQAKQKDREGKKN